MRVDADSIVFKRAWIFQAGLAALCFVAGGIAGYGVAWRNIQSVGSAGGTDQSFRANDLYRFDMVSADDDPFIGPPDAPVTIVEFSDFTCPYCRHFHQNTFDVLIEMYDGQIRFVARDFPVVGGQLAAEAAGCANAQGAFWEYGQSLYSSPTPLVSFEQLVSLAAGFDLDTEQFQACVDLGKYRQEVLDDTTEGRTYGVTGVPTFFINGIRLVGSQPLASFQTIIDQELANQ